ncbi:MAG: LysR family transcriptional regulator [Parasphingopyxis sp.]|nr:LysR family transcriptional regulator [Sphingomonadales bacterium]
MAGFPLQASFDFGLVILPLSRIRLRCDGGKFGPVWAKFDRAAGCMDDLKLRLEDARWYLILAAEGSIRGAADALSIPVSTLRYRLDRLENMAGGPLFWRRQGGVELTPAGARMRRLMQKVMDAAKGGIGDAQEVLTHPGQLTISAGEAVGAVWLSPLFSTLQAQLPQLVVSLHCDYDLAHAHSDRADVGLTYIQPSDPDLIVARIGTLHMRCYGTERYFRKHGVPKKPEDLRDHHFIEQVAPGFNSQLREFFIGKAGGDSFIRFRTNSSLAHYYAVSAGRGIGFMPTYISHLTDHLRMVDLGVPIKFDMQYFYHREAKHSPVIRTAIDWLKAAFDPQVYPYFADEFVHPDECRSVAPESNVVALFPSQGPRK